MITTTKALVGRLQQNRSSWRRSGICIFVIVAAAAAQQPTFEVASIRPAAPITPEMVAAGKLHTGVKIDAGRVDIGYASLLDLAIKAYEVRPSQVTGPKWMDDQRFDVLATMPAGATKEQVPAMLRALLEQRFKLVAHRTSREQAVYSLEVSKGGLKFKKASAQPEDKADMAPDADTTQERLKELKTTGSTSVSSPETGKMRMAMGDGGQMRMEMDHMSMAALAQMLSPMLDRPVVDHTELKGSFQIALDLSLPDMMQLVRGAGGLPIAATGGADVASDPSGGTIFMSVQKLGLRLEKKKGPVETIIVDSAEKNPTDN